jgi:predicted ester cyclase
MSVKENMEMFRTVVDEGFNKGNLGALDRLFAADYQEHQFGLRPTLDGMKQDITFLRTAFTDFHLEIEDMVASEDEVWARMTGSGTNHGPFMGPPTGKPIKITVFDVLRFKDGKITDHWGVPDRFAVMHQLGLIPQMQAP